MDDWLSRSDRLKRLEEALKLPELALALIPPADKLECACALGMDGAHDLLEKLKPDSNKPKDKKPAPAKADKAGSASRTSREKEKEKKASADPGSSGGAVFAPRSKQASTSDAPSVSPPEELRLRREAFVLLYMAMFQRRFTLTANRREMNADLLDRLESTVWGWVRSRKTLVQLAEKLRAESVALIERIPPLHRFDLAVALEVRGHEEEVRGGETSHSEKPRIVFFSNLKVTLEKSLYFLGYL